MRGKSSCMALSAAFALSIAMMTGVAQAGPKPQPSNANEYGKGYAELTAEWLQSGRHCSPDRELLLGQHAGIRRCRLVTCSGRVRA
jgi:hypothetical protein